MGSKGFIIFHTYKVNWFNDDKEMWRVQKRQPIPVSPSRFSLSFGRNSSNSISSKACSTSAAVSVFLLPEMAILLALKEKIYVYFQAHQKKTMP